MTGLLMAVKKHSTDTPFKAKSNLTKHSFDTHQKR